MCLSEPLSNQGQSHPRSARKVMSPSFPVLEEVLVVEKRLLLKEELRITRHATTEVAELPVTVRKQRAVVERLSSEGENITASIGSRSHD